MSAPARSFLIVLPTKNEALVLEQNVRLLVRFLEGMPTFGRWSICIADNGSTDATPAVAAALAADPRIRWFHLDASGRGRALQRAWNEASEDTLCYMDADLSVDLMALLHLLGEISRGADLAYGSRFAPMSEIDRSLLREITSRGYNLLARLTTGLKARDAQCGFKAVRREAWEKLKTRVDHPGWFFDTQLLLAAEESGMRLAEIPVSWVEARDKRRKSTVNLYRTIRDYLMDLRRERARRKARAAAKG
ncbi:glycosyltransferase [Patescibacteria group bacterium]|nr:MAG: glycosyltransferase [Patescibacteria group bacterium]